MTLSVLLPLPICTRDRSYYKPLSLPVTRYYYPRHALYIKYYLNLNTSRKIGITIVDKVDNVRAVIRYSSSELRPSVPYLLSILFCYSLGRP
jgi:hypothetical protein